MTAFSSPGASSAKDLAAIGIDFGAGFVAHHTHSFGDTGRHCQHVAGSATKDNAEQPRQRQWTIGPVHEPHGVAGRQNTLSDDPVVPVRPSGADHGMQRAVVVEAQAKLEKRLTQLRQPAPA